MDGKKSIIRWGSAQGLIILLVFFNQRCFCIGTFAAFNHYKINGGERWRCEVHAMKSEWQLKYLGSQKQLKHAENNESKDYDQHLFSGYCSIRKYTKMKLEIHKQISWTILLIPKLNQIMGNCHPWSENTVSQQNKVTCWQRKWCTCGVCHVSQAILALKCQYYAPSSTEIGISRLNEQ